MTLNAAFWNIVDANWTTVELDGLVRLTKRLERERPLVTSKGGTP